MTTLEILKAARALLSDEKQWTKGVYARTAENLPCAPTAQKDGRGVGAAAIQHSFIQCSRDLG